MTNLNQATGRMRRASNLWPATCALGDSSSGDQKTGLAGSRAANRRRQFADSVDAQFVDWPSLPTDRDFRLTHLNVVSAVRATSVCSDLACNVP